MSLVTLPNTCQLKSRGSFTSIPSVRSILFITPFQYQNTSAQWIKCYLFTCPDIYGLYNFEFSGLFLLQHTCI